MAMPVPLARAVGWLRARPARADGLLAGAMLAVTLVAGFTSTVEPARDADAWFVALATVTVLPVAARRVRPVPAFAVSAAGLLVLLAVDYFGSGAEAATVVCAYSVAAHARPVAARTTLVVFAAVLTVYYLTGRARGEAGATIAGLLGNALVLGITWVLGDAMRQRREREEALVERAQRAERERRLLAAQAVAEERATIARELHDSVAHAVSVMVIQAGAARRRCSTDPATAAEAMAVVEATGREALAELRRLVGMLRDDDEVSLAPQPTLAALPALAAADPALTVDLTVEGEVRPLPASVELSAYRIVQEALTNVRKHAGPARAEVLVRYRPDSLEVLVRDDGRGASVPPNTGGHGLLGMQERAGLCGGVLHAGPRPGGGWQVRAVLPTPETDR